MSDKETKIKVRLTKISNAKHYNVNVGDVVEISLYDYLCSVVGCEMYTQYIEAYKAQAVASRTYAYPYCSKGKAISDDSSTAQCFAANIITKSKDKNLFRAVEETDDELLYYDGIVIKDCVFSASNGGKTTSSQERWGTYRPYLISKSDLWDCLVSNGTKRGHGVGMSQVGAMFAAQNGYSYKDILSFYYPDTKVLKGGEEHMSVVLASELIEKFKQMLNDKKWEYIANSAEYRKTDCSGAFTYWYGQLGSTMYHGSNTMYRKWSTRKGSIDQIELVPGMAVYKVRDWNEKEKGNPWYGTAPGDIYHVGLYVGDGKVIEAKSTKADIVESNVNEWHLTSELINTKYDIGESNFEIEHQPDEYPCYGVVALSSGYLKLRNGASRTASEIGKLYNEDVVLVKERIDDWYHVEFNGTSGYAHRSYIDLIQKEAENTFSKTKKFEFFIYDSETEENIKKFLYKNGIEPVITEVED